MTTAPASAKKLTATEVAALLSAELIGSSDAEFGQVQDLKTATANEVSFFRSAPNEMGKSPSESDYQTLRQSGAGLILVDAHCPPPEQCHIKVDDPGLAATILAQFWQCRRRKLTAQIHPSAVIDPSADVAPSAFIGANCVIGANVKIGANTILHPAVVVYDDVQIGSACVIQSNSTIGSDGFGYTFDGSQHLHMPQIGGVQIGNGVEIGANCCIDSGTFAATQIGDGCIFDNMVQIGHNAIIGRFVVMCGQVGISGSATIGDGAVFAGKSGAAGHLHVGAGAKVAARAAVMGDVEPGQTVAGQPAVDLKLFQRMMAILRKSARRG